MTDRNGHLVEHFPGSTQTVPALLTAEEAAVFLRLDVGRDTEAAQRSLRRLVERKLLRPCRIGKESRFARDELLRLIRHMTDINGAADL